MTTPRKLVFLFFHYGKIPNYLLNAIEHVRIFNPDAEIWLTTETKIVASSRVQSCNVQLHVMSEFSTEELTQFKKSYVHISCFKEKFERFVLERWFVAEVIRGSNPENIYIMLDSDVAVFGDVSKLLESLPDKPICLSGNNPHFTFIKGPINDFLSYILKVYDDNESIKLRKSKHFGNMQTGQLYNFGEMELLFEYLAVQRDMENLVNDNKNGYIDCNIHIPENLDYIQLKRRPRKKVCWALEFDLLIPYFIKNGIKKRAFIIHFQGPGKRLFFRFNQLNVRRTGLFQYFINVVFSRKISNF